MDIKKLTYKNVEQFYQGEEITKYVMAARDLAWDTSQSADPKDYFVLDFNYFEVNGKTYNHFVILDKKFESEVSSEWSSAEFNAWERDQSICDISVIRDLSTDLDFKKLVTTKKELQTA